MNMSTIKDNKGLLMVARSYAMVGPIQQNYQLFTSWCIQEGIQYF